MLIKDYFFLKFLCTCLSHPSDEGSRLACSIGALWAAGAAVMQINTKLQQLRSCTSTFLGGDCLPFLMWLFSKSNQKKKPFPRNLHLLLHGFGLIMFMMHNFSCLLLFFPPFLSFLLFSLSSFSSYPIPSQADPGCAHALHTPGTSRCPSLEAELEMVSQRLLGRHQVKPVSSGLKAKGKRWFFKQRLVTLVTSVQQDAAGAGTLRRFRIGWINSQKEKKGRNS